MRKGFMTGTFPAKPCGGGSKFGLGRLLLARIEVGIPNQLGF